MQKWTKKHAKFVGRIIFANFLKLPLENYRNIIKEAEESICALGCGKNGMSVRYISRSKLSNRKTNKSSNVVAEIKKTKKGLGIRYAYSGFNKIYLVDEFFERKVYENESLRSLMFRIKRISSRNEITHRILEGIISHQRKYLQTGNQIDLVPFRQIQLPIDNSWTSRLVNGLSAVTPSGEEKSLKWFFQTEKDINKRLIKLLLDRENEDIESGKLKKPLTDSQIRSELEKKYGLLLSRHSISYSRKDMGIPSAKRRLSGYKYPPLSANFSLLYPLVLEEVLKNAPESSGIYEFRLKGKEIEYPNGKTKVIYIGSTRNIKKRLRDHLSENNKNGNIKDFLKNYGCSFRYIQFSKNWKEEERRLFNLFGTTYGTPPRCNRVRP